MFLAFGVLTKTFCKPMPLRNRAARANAQNIRRHFANQKCVHRDEDDTESESIQHYQRKDLMIAAAAQTVPSTDLDPEITNFCSHLNITPAIREFHDENESGPELCLSDQSSDIEEGVRTEKVHSRTSNHQEKPFAP